MSFTIDAGIPSRMAASDLVRLQYHGVNSGLLQLPGRKNSRDTGADHRHIRLHRSLQRGTTLSLICFRPD